MRLYIEINMEATMRQIYFLTISMFMLLVPCAACADDYQDCISSCSAERDSKNADCPSPYDTSEQQRDECIKSNQAAYEECVIQCPAPATPAPPPSGAQQPAPPVMGY
jgi:hypothetical protein